MKCNVGESPTSYKPQKLKIMQTVIENITPAKAREYYNSSLAEDKKHRPVSMDYIKSYADTMRQGRWLMNGIPIVFDTDGCLIDGCHRMLAVEMAGIPVQFMVVRGVPSEAFTTFDCGRHRTVGQLLAMQGIKNYNLVASIVIANARLVKTGRMNENNARSGREKVTNDARYEEYSRDPEGFNEVASIIVKLIQRCRILSASWAGGLYYYLTHTGGYTKEEVDPFFDGLFSLDTCEISSINRLRKKMTDASMQGKKLKAEYLFAIITKTWNAYIEGREIKRLDFNPEIEKDYPTLKLK